MFLGETYVCYLTFIHNADEISCLHINQRIICIPDIVWIFCVVSARCSHAFKNALFCLCLFVSFCLCVSCLLRHCSSVGLNRGKCSFTSLVSRRCFCIRKMKAGQCLPLISAPFGFATKRPHTELLWPLYSPPPPPQGPVRRACLCLTSTSLILHFKPFNYSRQYIVSCPHPPSSHRMMSLHVKQGISMRREILPAFFFH